MSNVQFSLFAFLSNNSEIYALIVFNGIARSFVCLFVWVHAKRLCLRLSRRGNGSQHNIYDAFNIILNLVFFCLSPDFFSPLFLHFYFSEYITSKLYLVSRMEIIGIRAIFGLFFSLGGMYVFEGFPH